MVASIINAMVAEHERNRTEEDARGVVIYFHVPVICPDHPIEQTRKRLEALELFPWAPPAGNA